MDFPGYECFSNAILSLHFSLKAGPKRPESHNFDNFLDFLHRYQKGIFKGSSLTVIAKSSPSQVLIFLLKRKTVLSWYW